jgi:hypothetical protein
LAGRSPEVAVNNKKLRAWLLLGLLGNPLRSGWQKAKSERRKKRLAKFGGVVECWD